MSSNNLRIRFPFSTLFMLAILLLSTSCTPKLDFNGSVIEPPIQAKSFSLTDQDNKITSLSDLQGKYVLLFFGFTSCLDVCPATMAVLAQVRNGLGENADAIQIAMISTDPSRDTPEAMKEFIDRFDSASIGLTGTLEELELVWADYGVMVMDSGETHSARVYLIDPVGMWRLTYSSADNPDVILADLEQLLGIQ